MTIKPQSEKQKDRIVSNVNILNSDIVTSSDSIVNTSSQQPGQNQRRLNKNISVEQNVVAGPARRLDDYEDLASRNHHRSPNKSNAHRALKRSSATVACGQHHFGSKLDRTDLNCQLYQKKFQTSPQPHTQISTCSTNPNSPKQNYEYKSNTVKATNSALHPSTSKPEIDSHDLRASQQKTEDASDTYPGNSSGQSKVDDENVTGYNSGDEYMQPKDKIVTTDEWEKRDEQFKKSMFNEHAFQITTVGEDGACLFRAISLQIYGDQEMHEVIRQQTMDYIYENREYFAQFVTENIVTYINRKRNKYAHGNHIEIQAISEIYNRPIELYCYNTKPFNIFNPEQLNNGYEPLRLSYQRNSHYNAIIDPYNHTVGIGLGLAGYKPESQTQQAMKLSEQLEIEHTMFEDKLKTTDWDATNDEIVEQIARESYIQWCRDNQKMRTNQQHNHDYETKLYHHQKNQQNSTSSATITSATASTSSKSATVTGIDPSEYLRPSSSKMHRAIDPQSTNILKKNLKFLPSTSTLTDQSYKFAKCRKRTTKPKLRSSTQQQDCDSDSTLSCKSDQHISYFDNSSITSPKILKLRHTSRSKRYSTKYAKRSKSLSPRHYSNTDTISKFKLNETKLQKVDEIFENQEKDELPSDCRQAINENCPVSKFYQSLLESSYRDDGLGQLTENEMVLKGIEQSRMEYIKTEKINLFPANSNFENYRYNDNLSMYFTLDKDST